MNFYNQWPLHVSLVIDRKRKIARVFSIPESDEAGISLRKVPSTTDVDLSISKLIVNGQSYENFVKNKLEELGRNKTNSSPIDRIIDMEDLFGDAPLNRFTYEWLNSEIAEIFQIPFSGYK